MTLSGIWVVIALTSEIRGLARNLAQARLRARSARAIGPPAVDQSDEQRIGLIDRAVLTPPGHVVAQRARPSREHRTTEVSGSTTTKPFRIRLARRIGNTQPAPNLRAPWCASKDGAVLLTCGFSWWSQGDSNP